MLVVDETSTQPHPGQSAAQREGGDDLAGHEDVGASFPGTRSDLGDPVAVARECGLHAVPPRHRGVEDRLAEAQSGGAQTLDRNVQIVPVLRQPDILVGCIVGMNAEVERDGRPAW